MMPEINDTAIPPLLITGMHRSGTSLVASLLEAGGYVPGIRLLPSSTHNPHGYYEDADWVALQGRMLRQATQGGRGGWPDWGWVDGETFDSSGFPVFRDEALHLLHAHARSDSLWGWKDPRTSLLLDFWFDLVPTARFCFVYRDPWEVAHSVAKLGEEVFIQNPGLILDIWCRYNQALLAFQQTHPDRCALIGIQRLIETPAALPDLLRNRLGIEIKPGPEWLNRLDAGLLEAPRHPDEMATALDHPGIRTTLKALHEAADWPGEIPLSRQALPHQPSVSIIIPCHNDGCYLAEAVASVERIQNTPYEIIMVDDGSDQPETLKILADMAARGHTLLHQPASGLAAARNQGIRRARGPYILPLDADNRVHANYLIKACQILNEQPDVDVVYANPRRFGTHPILERMPDYSAARLVAGNFIDACALFRRSLWEKIDGFDEHIPTPQGYEDWDFWLAASGIGAGFAHLDEFLFDYRVRENSLSAACNIPENRERLVDHILAKHRGLVAQQGVQALTFLQTMSAYRVLNHQAQLNASLETVAALRQERTHQQEKYIQHWVDKFRQMADQKELLEAELLNQQKRQHAMALQLARIEQTLTVRLRNYFWQVKTQIQSPPPQGGVPPSTLSRWTTLLSAQTRRGGRRVIANVLRLLYLWAEPRRVQIIEPPQPSPVTTDGYMSWWEKQRPDARHLAAMRREIQDWASPPLISILLPVYNVPPEYLKAALDSIRRQVYPHWEVCAVDDASTRSDTQAALREVAATDPRIRTAFRTTNGHISRCSNDALAMAQGSLCALMDHDDLLAEEALFEVAREWMAHPNLDLIYTDEDKVDESGRHYEPHFKPDWCPENMLTRNYLGHLNVVRTSLLRDIGGFRTGFEGSQDYDLLLRLTERTRHIAHIPKVLYGWRVSAQSVAGNADAKPYAYIAAQAALTEALQRRGEEGVVKMITYGFYETRRPTQAPGRVSVILPTGTKAGLLNHCLQQMIRRTAYRNFEIIAIDSSGGNSRIQECLSDWSLLMPGGVRIIPAAENHTLPYLINRGVAQADGDVLLLIQPHLEVVQSDWIEILLEQAQRPSIGAVGCHLMDSARRFRHCGMVLGPGADGVEYLWRGAPVEYSGHLNMLWVISMFSAVSVTCCMVRRSVFQEVQGFDESIPEPQLCGVDFCLRCGARGYHNICHPRVRLIENEPFFFGETKDPSDTEADQQPGRLLFRERWQHLIRQDPCVNEHLIRHLFPEPGTR